MAWFLAGFFVLAVLEVDALAQRRDSTASNVAKPEVIKLALKNDPSVKRGKVAALSGAVNQTGAIFVLEGLDIMQPVAVMLLAADGSQDLQLEVFKPGTQQPARQASTKGEGMARFHFRTQGDLQIAVRSGESRPLPFRLIAWVGDEPPSEMDDVVVPMKK